MQASDPLDPHAVLGAVKAQPGDAGASCKPSATAGLDRPCARPDGGLSANQHARALKSMMARSTTRSNLRPDTLMQDRRRQFDEIFLQRTAGPYIRVRLGSRATPSRLPLFPQQQTF